MEDRNSICNPETELISRREAIDALLKEFERDTPKAIRAKLTLEKVPPAHPEMNEWCRDCSEYDRKHNRCPRWNRVIRQTVEEMKQNTEVL